MKLALTDVSFSYVARRKVLEKFSCEIPSGRTVLLGPNGAGKSTLLGILASVLSPRSGQVSLQGLNDLDELSQRKLSRYRKEVAWLPQDFVPFPGLTVAEHVSYAGWLKGMSKTKALASTPAALKATDLESLADRSVKQLSGGQRRRLGLAGAIVHNASVILLDEPTAGLDPLQRERFRELLQGIEETKIVVVSTHQTEDVHDSYQHVILLDRGVIPFQGTVEEFTHHAPAELDHRDRVSTAYSQFIRAEE